MFWIFLVAVLVVLIWALHKHSASSAAGQNPTSLAANQSQSAPRSRVQPPPSGAAQATNPGFTNVRTVRTSALVRRPSTARWIPPGETAEVAGFPLPNGTLYVGSGLQPVKEWVLDVEPALLDPSLPIDKRSADFDGRLMAYWPSYSNIPPACRSGYLQWLAGGQTLSGQPSSLPELAFCAFR